MKQYNEEQLRGWNSEALRMKFCYETECPYLYGEINECMYAEPGVPSDMQRQCDRDIRIIIAGTRTFNDYKLLKHKVNEIIQKDFITDAHVSIISGTCEGADQLGEKFAEENGYYVSRFPAEWDLYGRDAGMIRNKKMAKFAMEDDSIGVLIAFWNGKSPGTRGMLSIAHKYGLRVNRIIYKE